MKKKPAPQPEWPRALYEDLHDGVIRVTADPLSPEIRIANALNAETARANRNAEMAAERLRLLRRMVECPGTTMPYYEARNHVALADAVYAFGDVEIRGPGGILLP